MKNTIPHKAATVTIILAAFILSSCIYEAPGDRFYRTLWESSENGSPFGSMTLEFLCGEMASVSAPGTIGSFGSYAPSGTTATFDGLTLTRDKLTAHLIEAHRNGDRLTLQLSIDGPDPDLSSGVTGPDDVPVSDATRADDGQDADIPSGVIGRAGGQDADIPSGITRSAGGQVLNSTEAATMTITMHRLSAYK